MDPLQESHDKFRIIFNLAPTPMAVNRIPDLLFTDVNHAFLSTLGYSREEIVGKPIGELNLFVEPEKQQEVAEQMRTEGRIADIELQVRCKDDRILDGLFAGEIIEIQGQEHFLTVMTDQTERKRHEVEKIRGEKLESLGTLAGGLAHDFNNLMSIVQGYIDLTLDELTPDHPTSRWLEAAMKAVSQTKDLTNRLITFSRGGNPRKGTFDLGEMIVSAGRDILKETRIREKYDFAPNLWPVEADMLQMKQVFHHLFLNAAEAMPDGGNLTIKTENKLIYDRRTQGLRRGSYVKVSLSDDGAGIPKANLTKIFDPYFSTKERGAQKGLGLGLAVCYSILNKHGGLITAKSHPGKGATFQLFIPASVNKADFGNDSSWIKKRP